VGRQTAEAIAALSLVALALSPAAEADIGVRLSTKDVHVGGILRGWSNGRGFPVYIVPSALAPKNYACRKGTAICAPTAKRPPGKPFVLLGRVPGRAGDYGKRWFAFRVPRVRPGLYRVFIYCRPCGRSLIQSGSRVEGETIRVRPAASVVTLGSFLLKPSGIRFGMHPTEARITITAKAVSLLKVCQVGTTFSSHWKGGCRRLGRRQLALPTSGGAVHVGFRILPWDGKVTRVVRLRVGWHCVDHYFSLLAGATEIHRARPLFGC
jgi:hypothetical protein